MLKSRKLTGEETIAYLKAVLALAEKSPEAVSVVAEPPFVEPADFKIRRAVHIRTESVVEDQG